MAKMRKKEYMGISVYEATKMRLRNIYKQFDTVVFSFSGGKDSTASLNMGIEVARELGKLPIKVVHFDEEVITPPTVDYVNRVSKLPEVELYWFCVELRHRNACSNLEPYWWSWDRDKKDKWVRPLPAQAITSIKGFNGKEKKKSTKTGIAAALKYLFTDAKKYGKVCFVTGIRTEESLMRYTLVSQNKHDNYINNNDSPNQFTAHPIYDWSSNDVWLAVKKFDWDYNKTYDVFNLTENYHNKLLKQRICAPYGEEPLRNLDSYRECFPQFWAKLSERVEGVGSASRYANTNFIQLG